MFRNVVFNGLSDVTLLITGFAASLLLTRALGPFRWGEYSQVAWLISICSVIFGCGFTYTATRFLAALRQPENSHEIQPFVRSISALQLSIVTAGSFLLYWMAPGLLRFTGWRLDVGLLRAAAIGIVSFTMLQLGIALLRGFQKFQALFFLSVFSSIGILSAVLVTIVRPSVKVLILSVAIGQFILLPWLFRLVREQVEKHPRSRQFISPNFRRTIVRFTLLIFFTTLIDQVVWQRSEIFFLARLQDTRQSGYYALGYTVSQLGIGTLPFALCGVLTPLFSSFSGPGYQTDLISTFKKAFRVLNFMIWPLSAGLFAIAPALLSLLYGEEFLAATPILRLLILSTTIGIFSRPGASILHALNKPHILLLGSLLALPVDIILAWILVPRYSGIGAAMANLAASILGAGFVFLYGVISLHLPYEWNSLYKNLVSASACGLVAFLLTQAIPAPGPAVGLAVLCGGIVYLLVLVLWKDGFTTEAIRMIHARYARNGPFHVRKAI